MSLTPDQLRALIATRGTLVHQPAPGGGWHFVVVTKSDPAAAGVVVRDYGDVLDLVLPDWQEDQDPVAQLAAIPAGDLAQVAEDIENQAAIDRAEAGDEPTAAETEGTDAEEGPAAADPWPPGAPTPQPLSAQAAAEEALRGITSDDFAAADRVARRLGLLPND